MSGSLWSVAVGRFVLIDVGQSLLVVVGCPLCVCRVAEGRSLSVAVGRSLSFGCSDLVALWDGRCRTVAIIRSLLDSRC